MEYHLYHHDDLDGLACGAVMLEFLKSRGDKFSSHHPITYGAGISSENWVDFKFERPFMIFDFQYHPDAEWWVDHHASSAFEFIGGDYEDKYKNDKQHHFDGNAPSACGLMVRLLEDEHGFDVSNIIRTLAREVDIVDSAGFKSIEEALDFDRPIKQFDLLLSDIDIDQGNDEYYDLRVELMNLLAVISLEDIVNDTKYKGRIIKLKNIEEQINEEVGQRGELRGKVVFVDAHDMERVENYAALWKRFPDAPYAFLIKPENKGFDKLRIIRNNWIKHDKEVNLGDLASKRGGGGHKGIGAIYAHGLEEAYKVADEIIDFVNKNG
ncbi:MAG: hypothetical protein ABH833_00555 [Parcubacteria group bacterium]